jgi:hypothetical protein
VWIEYPGRESRCPRQCPHHSPVRGLDTRLDLPIADHQTTLVIPRYQHDPLVQPRVELLSYQRGAPTVLVSLTHLVETREHVR